MSHDGVDWDVLTRLAAEGFGLWLAAAPPGGPAPAPTAGPDGVLIARPPRLVLASGTRIDGTQLARVLARWPVLRRDTPCVRVDVVSVAGLPRPVHLLVLAARGLFPPSFVAAEGRDEG